MSLIPYADLNDEALRPLVERITAERGSVLELYQMLLHSPAIAEGWLNYLTAVRQRSSLPGDLRELVIVRIALVNGAPYEAQQHTPLAIQEGVSQQQIDDLAQWQSSPHFDDNQRAVLAYADAMTRDVHVPAEISAQVRARFAPQQLVELTATIAAYNMVSRFLEALQIR